jgi:hypothetical protein
MAEAQLLAATKPLVIKLAFKYVGMDRVQLSAREIRLINSLPIETGERLRTLLLEAKSAAKCQKTAAIPANLLKKSSRKSFQPTFHSGKNEMIRKSFRVASAGMKVMGRKTK